MQTVAEILSTAERLRLSPLTVVMRIHDGVLPDIKPSVKRKLATFVPPLRKLQKLAREVRPPDTPARTILTHIWVVCRRRRRPSLSGA